MKLATWKVRSLYRSGSLKAAVGELQRYKLYVVGVQEVRRGKGGTLRERDMISSTGKEMIIINLEDVYFVHCRILSAGKRVEFVSDRLSYIVLIGLWRNILLVNVHAPSKKSKDIFMTN